MRHNTKNQTGKSHLQYIGGAKTPIQEQVISVYSEAPGKDRILLGYVIVRYAPGTQDMYAGYDARDMQVVPDTDNWGEIHRYFQEAERELEQRKEEKEKRAQLKSFRRKYKRNRNKRIER